MELRRYHSLIFLLQITGSYIELASDFYPYIENSVAENLATEIIDGIQKKNGLLCVTRVNIHFKSLF